MARWRGLDGPPASYLVSGSWPDGRVDGPVEAWAVQQLCLRLREAMGGRGLREVARAADVNHSSLRALLLGQAWPDVVTLARLEAAVGADLWPGRTVGEVR